MTTPFEREILTHYYCGPTEFPRMTDDAHQKILKFAELGLLRELPEANEYGAVFAANHDALDVYMEALAAVPLPTNRWVIE